MVTLGGHLAGSWMGAGHQKHEAMIRSLDFSATASPLPSPRERVVHCLVAQSCLTLRPHALQHTRIPYPSPSLRVCSVSCPLSQWCQPIISSSVISFTSSLLSFPASVSFQMSQFFQSGGQSIGASASASVLPWIFRVNFLSDGLVWSPFSSRDSQEYYPARQFKSINSWHSAFFMVWLSHP